MFNVIVMLTYLCFSCIGVEHTLGFLFVCIVMCNFFFVLSLLLLCLYSLYVLELYCWLLLLLLLVNPLHMTSSPGILFLLPLPMESDFVRHESVVKEFVQLYLPIVQNNAQVTLPSSV